MDKKILVTYATIHGSTGEIAGNITSTLSHGGFQVDLLPVKKVSNLDDYSLVILGGPLFMFHWHKDAFSFLSRSRKSIENGLSVAVFAGGPTGKGDDEEWQVIRDQFEKEMCKVEWFKPVSTLLVGGKFDPNHLRFPWNLLPALKKLPPVDYRDWNAIQSWAQSLPQMVMDANVEDKA